VTNEALIELHENLIDSLDAPTPMALRARLVYPEVRDACLETHPWNFATARADLARTDYEEADTPTSHPHWTYEFALPTGVGFHVPPYCLAVRGTTLDPNGPPWEVGTSPAYGRVLWSDEEDVRIIYTARIESLTDWSALARQVLVKMLASKLAKTDKLAEQKLKEAYGLLPVAKRTDMQEGSPFRLHPNRRLVSARQRTGSVSPYVGIRTYVP
jgi:hypothetical protein